ncbi:MULTISPECIES: oxygenase MpaB family protein [Arthrobacter]|uniref:oxygenase MpaB family protein n=1 Tax=unclassified Arthrobacter TaxID=235627 RepID=UPI0024B91937|nr:oxygenase MpaB family protein [Arthrobacter sp. H35-MC1]MDJ0316121.1 oxygenase MpaB family protein [Arthrobacter sp. H35-MC1]
MENIVSRWQRELRGTFANNSLTIPQWQVDLEKGDDGGYFGPGSAVWAVHGSMTTTVAGIQALLIQALHPGALAGVHDHSNYRTDPLGRLAGTIRWIFTVSYGDTATAQKASAKVLRIHEHIHGTYTTNNGDERPYTANNPELLRWVHLAFTQAFLGTHQAYGEPIPDGADAYVGDWAVAGALMRVLQPPVTVQELQSQLAGFTPELRYDHRVKEIVTFIKNPPLPRSQQGGYKILFAAAVASLPEEYRELLRLNPPRLGQLALPMTVPTKAVLGVVGWSLGPISPSESAARRRRSRLGMGEIPKLPR